MTVGELIDALSKFPRETWVRLDATKAAPCDSGSVRLGTYWHGAIDTDEACVVISASTERDRECEN